MKTYTVQWQKPVEIEFPFDANTGEYDFKPINLPKDTAGLYQIIANHPLYGKGQTLYIGKAQNIDRRNFQRFSDLALKFWRLAQPIKIGIGLVYDDKVKNITDKATLTKIEALLIARHMPALNSTGIDRLREDAHQILVVNDGYTNGLVPDCSGVWFGLSED